MWLYDLSLYKIYTRMLYSAKMVCLMPCGWVVGSFDG